MCRALLILSMLVVAVSPAEARLFWQTYGSTVSSPTGGCVWNANSEYFVPRTCETGRYGLFSPCKQDLTTSPACRHAHQLYTGYCSPFGACHYRWRDHVYRSYCGCPPLACCHGPWHNKYLGSCQPPLMRLCHSLHHKPGCGQQPCSAQGCSAEAGPRQAYAPACHDYANSLYPDASYPADASGTIFGSGFGSGLEHIESAEVAVLGTLPADSLNGGAGQPPLRGGNSPAVPPSGIAPPSFTIPSFGAAQPRAGAASPTNAQLPANTSPAVLQLLGIPPQ